MTRRFFATISLLALFAWPRPTAAAESVTSHPLWILVTPPALRPAMEPLAKFRADEGFRVSILETAGSIPADEGDAMAIHRRIQELCAGGNSNAYVLLAGAMPGSGSNQDTIVPSLRGKHARMKGVLSDFAYGLPDDSSLPTIAVGRQPARNAEEARLLVQKTLRFETNNAPAPWRNRLVLLIGNPGGGPLPEMFVQQSIGPHLAMLDPIWEVHALYHAGSSRYFAPTDHLRETSVRYLEAGELFSFYMGHSNPSGLWSLSTIFLSREDWSRIRVPEGNGIFFTCGCFSCQPGGRDGEGYGLAAMRNPNGPVAVIGATAESYSAPGQLAAEGLIERLRKNPFPKRLGEYWLAVQAGLAAGKMDESVFSLYDQADGSGGKIPLATQRLEHLEMWMLLGDPAMKLPLPPADMKIAASNSIEPGGKLRVNGRLPIRLAGAKIHLTLERPLNSSPQDLEALPPNTPQNREERARVALANLERANSLILTTAEATAEADQFTAEVPIPPAIPWKHILVRASALLNNDFAVAVLKVEVAHVDAGSQTKAK